MGGISLISDSTPMPTENNLPAKFVSVPENKNTCTFCQYLMYYLQIELSGARKESYIRESVMGACEKLPSVANEECKQFVAEYEPAVIALLAQEVDPSTEYIRESVMGACDKLPKLALSECKQFLCQYGPAVIVLLIQEVEPSSVCPAIGVCPNEKFGNVMSTKATTEPSCPLCLFAVEQLETTLQDNKTENNIRLALGNLCELSTNQKIPCIQFVDVNSNALVEMLLADLNAQEICFYLKLCKEQDTTLNDPMQLVPGAAPSAMSKPNSVSIDKYIQNLAIKADFNKVKKSKNQAMRLDMDSGGDIETNEVPDRTVNGHIVNNGQKIVCVVCEFVMQKINEEINGRSEIDIKQVVSQNICKRMPKNVRSDCGRFIGKYADLLISLLAQKVESSLVCEELKLCPSSLKTVIPTKGGAERAASDVALSDKMTSRGKAERQRKMRPVETLDCAFCETVVLAVKNVMKNLDVDTNIVSVIEKSCGLLPSKYSESCHTMLKIYGDSVIYFIEEYGSKQVCLKIGICSSHTTSIVNLHHQKINGETTPPRRLS